MKRNKKIIFLSLGLLISILISSAYALFIATDILTDNFGISEYIELKGITEYETIPNSNIKTVLLNCTPGEYNELTPYVHNNYKTKQNIYMLVGVPTFNLLDITEDDIKNCDIQSTESNKAAYYFATCYGAVCNKDTLEALVQDYHFPYYEKERLSAVNALTTQVIPASSTNGNYLIENFCDSLNITILDKTFMQKKLSGKLSSSISTNISKIAKDYLDTNRTQYLINQNEHLYVYDTEISLFSLSNAEKKTNVVNNDWKQIDTFYASDTNSNMRMFYILYKYNKSLEANASSTPLFNYVALEEYVNDMMTQSKAYEDGKYRLQIAVSTDKTSIIPNL